MSVSSEAPADLRPFIDTLHARIEGHATRADTEPFLELWSHTPDASIMAAVGGYHVGFDEVSKLLRWVSGRVKFETFSVEPIEIYTGGDLAASVELEHLASPADDQALTLRVSHVYRREEGAWRLLHRHAEKLTPVDETAASGTAN